MSTDVLPTIFRGINICIDDAYFGDLDMIRKIYSKSSQGFTRSNIPIYDIKRVIRYLINTVVVFPNDSLTLCLWFGHRICMPIDSLDTYTTYLVFYFTVVIENRGYYISAFDQ